MHSPTEKTSNASGRRSPRNEKPTSSAPFRLPEQIIDKDIKIEIWQWEGGRLRELSGTIRPDGEDNPLFDILPPVTGLRPSDIDGEGVADLQGLKTTADFIVRAGIPQEKLIDALEGVLRRDFKARVKLHLRTVEREVVVASGTYHVEAPLGDGQRTPLQLYGKFPIGEGKGEKFSGGFAAMLDRIGVLSARQVVNEVKEPPEGNPVWCEYDPVFRLDSNEDTDALLKHVTEQTGLMFKREKRSVKVLFVDRSE